MEPEQYFKEKIALSEGEYDVEVEIPTWDGWVAAFWEQYPDGRVEPFAENVYYLDGGGAVVGVSPGCQGREDPPFFVKDGTRYSW